MTPEDLTFREAVDQLARLPIERRESIDTTGILIRTVVGGGLQRAVPVLLPLLVARVEIARQAEGALELLAARARPDAWLSLDAHVRSHPGWLWTDEGARRETFARRWSTLGTDEAARISGASSRPRLVDAMLSMHRDGRVREAAIERIADACDPDSLPFLLVRCVDWVAPVRHRAARVAEAWIERAAADLVEMLPLLERLRAFRRADASSPVAKALERLASDPDALVASSLASRDPRVRARALVLLAETGQVTPERAVAFLRDGDSTVQVRAAMLVEALWTDPRSEIAGALAARMVRARPARVRAVGLRMSIRSLGPDARPLLLEHLADRNRGVRWIAMSELLAREPSFDVPGHLRALVRERPTLGAIEHLTDLRHPGDWELLVPVLDAALPAVARAAVRAMRRLDASASRELRLMMVDDPRPGVSREAARSMERDLWASDLPIVEGWLASAHAHVRGAAIRLAPGLPGWAGLSVLALADDTRLAPWVDRALRDVVRRRHARQAVSVDERDALARTIGAAPLVSAATRAWALELLDQMTR